MPSLGRAPTCISFIFEFLPVLAVDGVENVTLYHSCGIEQKGICGMFGVLPGLLTEFNFTFRALTGRVEFRALTLRSVLLIWCVAPELLFFRQKSNQKRRSGSVGQI